tara:strand:- start:955 stop:1065 length:111 start_codon:yes stop_codon:yes gene_type:complete
MKKPKKPKMSASLATLKKYQAKLKDYNAFMNLYKKL